MRRVPEGRPERFLSGERGFLLKVLYLGCITIFSHTLIPPNFLFSQAVPSMYKMGWLNSKFELALPFLLYTRILGTAWLNRN